MHETVFQIAVVWQIGLVAAIAWLAFRAESIVVRILALDVLSLLLIVVLATQALRSGQAGYLDVAIALALLVFVQTLAAVRGVEQRMERDD